MSKKPSPSDELAMLRFCAKHGIEVNKWPIFNAVNRARRLHAEVAKKLTGYGSELPLSKQPCLPFNKIR